MTIHSMFYLVNIDLGGKKGVESRGVCFWSGRTAVKSEIGAGPDLLAYIHSRYVCIYIYIYISDVLYIYIYIHIRIYII